jgi:S-adenosylmethionine:tRNA ribosyltransferase-isomerase
MRTKDFSFNLPEELIAQRPTGDRGASRLFVLDRGTETFTHSSVSELARHLTRGSLLVFNDSKVRKARLYAESGTGGRVEFLLLRRRGEREWLAMTTKARKQVPGKRYTFPGGVEGRIVGTEEDLRILELDRPIDDEYLDRWGHIPLPPYIRRQDDGFDAERYQTVYSRSVGSVAAPTAGLHFTEELLASLRSSGVGTAQVTLHVGLGTFLPVRAERIEDHVMHEEEYTVPEATAEAVNRARREGRPVVAVGTTSVRTLESAAQSAGPGEVVSARQGATDLFILPGYCFLAVDAMITNFHLPKSTLIMLVSAFAGREAILNAYENAKQHGYRFSSFGDAMLIL